MRSGAQPPIGSTWHLGSVSEPRPPVGCSPRARPFPKLALRLAQQQQTGIGGLGAAVKIYCEFLAADDWQVEGERRIVGHGGCGGGAGCTKQGDWTPICYVNRGFHATAVTQNSR